VQFGIQFGQKSGFINKGDAIVVVTGWRQGSGFTNTMRIKYVDAE
jgi:pyruvate kinase